MLSARNIATAAAGDFWQAEQDDAAEEEVRARMALQAGLRVHSLEECVEEIAKLGVVRVEELGGLEEQDIRESRVRLNPLQMRRLLTAIQREKLAGARASHELRLCTRTWELLCDGSSSGWYPPSFSQEPAGLRITLLEPVEIAGAVFDLSFGQGRTALSPLVSATQSRQHPDWSEFCISVDIGRGDKTALSHARRGGSGTLSLAVEGVSRQHATIQLLCGDGVPMEVRIRDNDSTNGTYLLRSSPPSFLPPQHPTDASTGAPQSDSGGAVRPETPALPLLQLRMASHLWQDLQGIPYLRLGPRLVLGLTVLKDKDDAWFGLQEVAHRTEQLLPHSQLRQQGWTEARLEEVCERRRLARDRQSLRQQNSADNSQRQHNSADPQHTSANSAAGAHAALGPGGVAGGGVVGGGGGEDRKSVV